VPLSILLRHESLEQNGGLGYTQRGSLLGALLRLVFGLAAAEHCIVIPVKKAKRPTNQRLQVVLLVLIALSLGVLALVLLARRPLAPHRGSTAQNVMRILFIGNSYTYVNNLPGLLMELSKQEPNPVDAEMVAEGGAMLENHWQAGKALAAIQRTRWDYVVLQEQSTFGAAQTVNGIDQIGDPASFYTYARRFDEAIRADGAKTLFFMTWARQNAPQNQAVLTSAYQHIARELGAAAAPVGLAWQRALSLNPALALHQDDGSHPDAAGSYLAACVFYATLYGKSPVGLPARISNTLVDDSGVPQEGSVNLSPADALFLQQAAWQAVSEYPS
jgi:hypothetical protein